MAELKPLEPGVFASAQLRPDDMAVLKAAGIALIVNNRPDGEDADQPMGAEIAVAAAAAGIDYAAFPMRGLPDEATVAGVADALANRAGDAVMFCRSGARSTAVWAMAARRSGAHEADELRRRAAAAGYDISRAPL